MNENIKPRDIVTREALENAITVDMALGCSTNSSLHLPAIAHEAGLKLDLHLFNEISEKTPNLCHLAPAGNHFMEELHEAGGVSAVMKELTELDLIHKEQGKQCGKMFKMPKIIIRKLFGQLFIHIQKPVVLHFCLAILRGTDAS